MLPYYEPYSGQRPHYKEHNFIRSFYVVAKLINLANFHMQHHSVQRT